MLDEAARRRVLTRSLSGSLGALLASLPFYQPPVLGDKVTYFEKDGLAKPDDGIIAEYKRHYGSCTPAKCGGIILEKCRMGLSRACFP